MHLHSNLWSGLQKTHLFCNRVRFGRSRSSKLDDFGTSRKRVCDFLPVRHCDYGPILHRFWDTATYWPELPTFPSPLSFGAPWNFVLKLTTRKLVMGLSSSEDRMIVARVVWTWYRPQTHRRMVRQTDGQMESIIANTALCIASYADVL